MKLCYITVSLTFIFSQIERAESSSLEETSPLLEEESTNQYDRAEPSSLEETFRSLQIGGTTVKVCTSKECKRTAEMLKTFMDPEQKPCTDFYNFACGKFRFPALFEDEVHVASSSIRSNELKRKLLSYLNSDNDHNIKAIGEIQRIFGLCKNEDSIRKFGDNVIQSQLKIVGLPLIPPFHPRPSTSKAKNFGRILAKIQRATGIPFLFSFIVEEDIADYRINQFYITLNDSTVSGFKDPKPEAEYFTHYSSENELKDYKRTYKNYMKRVVKYLYQSMNTSIFNNNQNFVSDHVRKVIKFLINVRQVINDGIDSQASLEYITMRGLQEKTDEILQKSNIKFSWHQYLSTLFENIRDVSTYFYSGKPLVVHTMKYLEKIFEVISSIDEEVFEAALWWVTVKDVTNLADKTLRKLEKEFTQDTKGFNYNRETICLCFAIDKFSYALTHLLLKEINDLQKYKKEIAEINENVKMSFIQIIHNALWMDKSTRDEAIRKLRNIETFISHDSWVESSQEIQQKYEKVKCKRSWYETKLELNVKFIEEKLELLFVTNHSNDKKFHEHILNIDIFYSSIRNAIKIPLGFLGLPKFNFGMRSMDYGALAYAIGYMFNEVFNEIGRTLDSYGNERNWWNEATLKKYKKREKCFMEFYYKFALEDDVVKFGEYFSPDQIISDNVGMKLALSAYDMYVAKYGPEEEKLIDFEEYSSEQLLMIAIASSKYWDPGYYNLEERYNDDIHRRSLYRLRINGMFMNSDRMGATWGCPVGMLMNPPEKCYMF